MGKIGIAEIMNRVILACSYIDRQAGWQNLMPHEIDANCRSICKSII